MDKDEIYALTEYQLREEMAPLLGWERIFMGDTPTVWWKTTEGRNHDGPPPANWETVGKIVEALQREGYTSIKLNFVFDKYYASVVCNFGPCERHKTTVHNWHGVTDIEGDTAFIAVARAAKLAGIGVE